MITSKINILLALPVDFQEQFEHVKARGEPLSQYIRRLILADRENELSTTVSIERVEISKPSKEIYHTLVQAAIKNNLPGFCGGFISSIMLKRSGLLNGLSLEEQKNILHELGYHIYLPIIMNQILPDYGCPRLYIHQDSGMSLSTDVAEMTKRYTLANHQVGAKVSTPLGMMNRIRKGISDLRPGFAGGFLFLPLVEEFLKCELSDKDIQQIMLRLGYHRHTTDPQYLVKDGSQDESLERYRVANTFVNHTQPIYPSIPPPPTLAQISS